eukprot:jgi/Astpho2/6683/Aster-05036
MLHNNELPCTPAAGFFDCPSGCFKLTCQLVELVTNATKPVLSLSTAMAGLAGGSGRLLIEYGSSAGVALLPCSSQGEPWCACAKQHSLLKTWPVASITLDNVGCLQTGHVPSQQCVFCTMAAGHMRCFHPCRYQVNYNVLDVSGNAADALVLEVDVYQSGVVQGLLLLIGAAPSMDPALQQAAALLQPGSDANVAFRTAMAAALGTYLAQISANSSAAAQRFGAVDAFAYLGVSAEEVAVANISLLQNFTRYVNGSYPAAAEPFGLSVGVNVTVTSTAYATRLSGSTQRRLLGQQTTGAAAGRPASTQTGPAKPVSHAMAQPASQLELLGSQSQLGLQSRHLLQSSSNNYDSLVYALMLKLSLLVTAFQGVSTCNATNIANDFYNGNPPSFMQAQCSTANPALLNSTVTAALGLQVALNSHLLQLGFPPAELITSPPVDIPLAQAAAVQGLLDQLQAPHAFSIPDMSVSASLSVHTYRQQLLLLLLAYVTQAEGRDSYVSDAAQALRGSQQPPYAFITVPSAQQAIRSVLASDHSAIAQEQAKLQAEAAAVGFSCSRADINPKYSFTVNSPAASGTVQRRQLRASSVQDSLLDGYEVQKQATYIVPFRDSHRLRFVGTKWSNRAAGGLLLTQERHLQRCRTLFAQANNLCTQPRHLGRTTLSSSHDFFGYDPVFDTSSALWQLDEVDQEAAYYNTTQGSTQVDYMQTPYGFFPFNYHKAEQPFPLLVSSQVSQKRSRQVLQFIRDGDYLDGETHTLDVKLISYSPSTQLLGVAAARFQWNPSGSVHSPRAYSTLPAGSRARWPYILVDVVKALLTLGFLMYLGCTMRHALAEASWQRSRCHKNPRLVLEWAAGLAMGAGWILSAVYVGLISSQLHPQADYSAYDAQASTPARYFLLLRSNLTAAMAAGAAASSQAGLHMYLAFVSCVEVLSNLMVAAAALQCMVLILLFSCLLRLW